MPSATFAQDALLGSQGAEPAAEELIHQSLKELVMQVLHIVNPLAFTGQTGSVSSTVQLLLGKGGKGAAELPDLLKPFMLTPSGRELVNAASMDVAELQQREEQLSELRELHRGLRELLAAVPSGSCQADSELRQLQATTLQSGLELIDKRSNLIKACPMTLEECHRYRAKAAQWVQSMETLTASAWEQAVGHVLDDAGQIRPDQAHAFRELRNHWLELAAARDLVNLGTAFLEEEEGSTELCELAVLEPQVENGHSAWQQSQQWRQQWAQLLDCLYELDAVHELGAAEEAENLQVLTKAAEALQAAAATLRSTESLAACTQQEQLSSVTSMVVNKVSTHAMAAFDQFMDSLVGKDNMFRGADNLLHLLPISTPQGLCLPSAAATNERVGAMASIASHQPQATEQPAIIVLSELLGYTPLAKQLEALNGMSLLQRACARCLGEAAKVQETLAQDALPGVFIKLLIEVDQVLQGAAAASEQASKDPTQLALHRLL